MTTINAYTPNATASAKAPAAAPREESGFSKLSHSFGGAAAMNGSTPFSTSSPSFGTRASGGFSLGEFLG